MDAKNNTAKHISIYVDGVWAGSGRLVNEYITDCGAVFASGQDEAEEIYDLLDEAIQEGKESLAVEHQDGTKHRYSWDVSAAEIV